MARGTPDQIAAKWASRLGQSTQAIKDGAMAVQVAPGQAAARQKEVWAQNVANSKDKWASRVASVSLSDWQTAMADKGAARVGQGATAATPKFTSFMAQLLPAIDQARSNLPPRGDINANLARANQFAVAMSKFQRR